MIEVGGGIFAKYSPIVVGLVLGSLAKFGRMIALDRPFTWRHVGGHSMMMGVCGLVAVSITDAAHITDPSWIAFTSAVMAIAASDVIQWLAQRAWKRFLIDTRQEAEKTTEALQHVRGEMRQNEQVKESVTNLKHDREGKA